MTRLRLITILFAAVLSLQIRAQSAADNHPATAVSITERLNAAGVVSVSHPAQLEQRLLPPSAAPAVEVANTEGDTLATQPRQITPVGQGRKMGGYRVQIFSDNNARTAKNEAESKRHAMAEAFPQYATYVVYTSPYWRLKVGDFRTHDEAEAAATEIKRVFPSFAREIRVVRDRINAPLR